MEKRDFGTTDLKTSILGFGGFHLLEISIKDVDYLLNTYLDNGGNYIETAALYGDGASEVKIGKSVSKRRDDYILATKTDARDMQGCLESLDRSLKNLKTDYIDLLIMHQVGTKTDDLEKILSPNGALKGAEKARKQGKIGYIGISMHGQGDILIKGLNKYPFDAVMAIVNYFDRFNFPEIENELIPLARQNKVAFIIMKSLADGFLYRSKQLAFRYALSKPASVIVTGMNTKQMLKENLNFFNNLEPLAEDEEILNALELGNYVCRQCGKCLPCPEGIDIPEIFKYEGYYDRQMTDGIVREAPEYNMRERLRFWFNNKNLALDKYKKLNIKADNCTECGECLPKCPYNIDIINKLKIAEHKLAGRKVF